MKLYTEEQVMKIIGRTKAYKNFSDNQLLETLTPIQLPSDEEIGKDIGSGMHDFYKGGFIEGAKWMKEQLLQPNL